MEDRGDDGENAAPARVGVSRRLRRGDAILCSEDADDDVRDGAPGRGLRGVLGISGIIIFEADYENRGETPILDLYKISRSRFRGTRGGYWQGNGTRVVLLRSLRLS